MTADKEGDDVKRLDLSKGIQIVCVCTGVERLVVGTPQITGLHMRHRMEDTDSVRQKVAHFVTSVYLFMQHLSDFRADYIS